MFLSFDFFKNSYKRKYDACEYSNIKFESIHKYDTRGSEEKAIMESLGEIALLYRGYNKLFGVANTLLRPYSEQIVVFSENYLRPYSERNGIFGVKFCSL